MIVIVAREAVAEAKLSILDYLQQLGQMPEPTELPPCKLPTETKAVPADVIGVARHTGVAEIIFHTFSWRTAVERARAPESKRKSISRRFAQRYFAAILTSKNAGFLRYMKMKSTTQIRKGLAVGSAMVLGAAYTEGTQTLPELTAGDTIGTAELLIEPSSGSETTAFIKHISITLPPVREWTKSDARRFSKLAAKRALNKATDDDQREFALLQHQRRLSSIGSPEDVLAEWRRRRFIGDLLTLLRRNVRLLRAEDQKKLRAIREA